MSRTPDPSVAGAEPPPTPKAETEPPAPALTDPLEIHAAALRDRHGDALHVHVESPFVVLGDEDPKVVRRRSGSTIRWAVDRLREGYFDLDPDRIVEVYLFGSAEAYRGWAWKLFKERPDTPYGYYSPRHGVLIMNIATGGGTLVHELVHPFMDANFPECPSWFDEGLASLYEQCQEHEGKIWGLTNWRLAGLQEAIRDHDVPSFEALTATGKQPFYDDDPGTNYAQARYLCYYLQERGLLRDYYKRFRQDHADDPTGYATLQRAVGYRSMKKFQRDWEAYVMRLRYG